ncbi:CAP domain-containing protein [Halteromyces radiatus]|uniref:CAP domain-containing protein n=1 Tax=Halteromyces radiatus TaxID=101107 RepID=UPI00221F5AEF|nr:CAP domain-containing protein [Halteromyces radiatus]KAI8079784.1 CAP domain-containing protein [Halteromyces radiatus]
MLNRFFICMVALALMLQFAYALPKRDINTIVKFHNKYRKLHGVPPLKWDKKVAQYAQNYSEKCVFQHSYGPYGENMAMNYPSWASIVDGWYSEVGHYNYTDPGLTSLHFTQIVWKDTTKVGCGLTKCPGGPITFCSYDAPGNVIGTFTSNVFPPK